MNKKEKGKEEPAREAGNICGNGRVTTYILVKRWGQGAERQPARIQPIHVRAIAIRTKSPSFLPIPHTSEIAHHQKSPTCTPLSAPTTYREPRNQVVDVSIFDSRFVQFQLGGGQHLAKGVNLLNCETRVVDLERCVHEALQCVTNKTRGSGQPKQFTVKRLLWCRSKRPPIFAN